MPWSGANVYGLPVGPGKFAATLGDGALQLAPITLTVGEGQLNLAPERALRSRTGRANDAAPARSSPMFASRREVSEAMLKFVAPVLSGATQSEGVFSMQLDGLRVPLADTKKADSAGQLTVHSVRVTPGPMTEQWVALAQQVEALAKRRDPAALQTGQQSRCFRSATSK